jgi:hypothetical protein
VHRMRITVAETSGQKGVYVYSDRDHCEPGKA